jgi:hypothetical protein
VATHAIHPPKFRLNHCKADYVHILLHDFLQECIGLLDANFNSANPWGTTIAKHFACCYGPSVTGVLCSLHPKIHIDTDSLSDTRHAIFSDHHWLGTLFQVMHQHMQQLPKEVIVQSLKGIPPYARPPYSSHSICASSSALVTHILSRVQYLCSLNSFEFFQVFFSVLPFHEQYHAP